MATRKFLDDTGLARFLNKVKALIPSKTSELTNDSGFTTNTGTITEVSAGSGLTGGGTSGSVSLSLETSGVTAGSFGPTANVSGANPIYVPRLTVDTYGRITSITSKTYTGTANNQVSQYSTTTSANYPLLFKYASGNTSTATTTSYSRFNNDIYVNPSTSTLFLKSVDGITVNDVTSLQMGSSTTNSVSVDASTTGLINVGASNAGAIQIGNSNSLVYITGSSVIINGTDFANLVSRVETLETLLTNVTASSTGLLINNKEIVVTDDTGA